MSYKIREENFMYRREADIGMYSVTSVRQLNLCNVALNYGRYGSHSVLPPPKVRGVNFEKK